MANGLDNAGVKGTGGLCYLRTFYLQIRLFTLAKLVLNDDFLVKNGLFICEFKIRGPKYQDVSTANYEGNLYSVKVGRNF